MLDRADMVSEAVESAIAQDYGRIEHCVVDGGSTDGTIEALSRYPHLRVQVHPNRGWADGLNLAIDMTKGDIVGFLCSDDLYEPDVFGHVVRTLEREPRLDAVCGRAVVFEDVPAVGTQELWCLDLATTGVWHAATFGTPMVNAWFFRRRVFDEIGRYDSTYRYSADREFLMRFALAGRKWAHLDAIVYRYRRHEGSLTFRRHIADWKRVMEENMRVAEACMDDPRIPAEARRLCRRWHSDRATTLASHALRYDTGRAALGHAARGWMFDALWPVSFLAQVRRDRPIPA